MTNTELLDRLWPQADFTPTERALLVYLLQAGAQPVSQDELLREVWGYRSGVKTRTVKVTVGRLRSKIEVDASCPEVLVTLRGRGYQLVPPGVTPTATLHEALVASGAAEDAPNRRTNMAPPLNRFIGRGDELDQLKAWLEQDTRLTLVHGPAGIGKTRLAQQLALEVMEGFPGGVWLCDFSDVRTTEGAVATVAATIGLFGSGEPLDVEARLTAALARRDRTLLVLDNAEQLPETAAPLLLRVIGQAPGLLALVTSRSRIGLEAAWRLSVGPLPRAHSLELLHDRIERTRLDRSQPLDPDCLDEIAATLEDVPLGLEMAAARARVVPLPELRARLRHSFDVLALDARDAPERQQTLEKAVAWSWDLLSSAERSALVQLSVLPGGGTLEIVEAVVQVEGDLLALLGRLLDKSMLRAWTDRGRRRFGLPESVRRYASSRQPTVRHAAAARHAAWATRLARAHTTRLDTDPQAGPALRRELDHLVAALRWLCAARDPAALELACDLGALFNVQGLPADLLSLLHQTRAALMPAGRPARRLASVLAMVARQSGDRAAAAAEIDASLPLAGDDLAARAELLRVVGALHLDAGRVEPAEATFRQALALAEAQGNAHLAAMLYNDVANTLVHGERLSDAVATYRRGIATAQEAGVARVEGVLWSNLAIARMRQGVLDRAVECVAHADALACRFDEPSTQHAVLNTRAVLLALDGRYHEADRLFAQLLEEESRLGGRTVVGATRTNAAVAALLVGDAPRAIRVLDEVRAQLATLPSHGKLMQQALGWQVAALATEGRLEQAEVVAELLTSMHPVLELPLLLAQLDVLKGRRAEAAGDEAVAAGHRAAAEAALAEDRADAPGVRAARALLEQALGAWPR